MKKTTIISGLLLSTLVSAQTSYSPDPSAQGGTVNTGYLRGGSVLASDPSDVATVVDGNSVACVNNTEGAHADNSYWRFFDLDGLGQVEITDIDFGVQLATSGTGGTQPVTVRVYSIPDGGSLPASPRTLVTQLDTTISDNSLSLVNIPISAMLDAATMDLVVELHTPDATTGGSGEGHIFFMGSNVSNQDNPLFLSSVVCGITDPTDVAAINFPDMHGIMVVNGLSNVPVELMNFSIE